MRNDMLNCNDNVSMCRHLHKILWIINTDVTLDDETKDFYNILQQEHENAY